MKLKDFADKFKHNKRLLLLLLFIFIGVFIPSTIFLVSQNFNQKPFITIHPTDEYIPGEVIVAFKEGYVPDETDEDKLEEIKKEFDLIGIKEYKPYFEIRDNENLQKYYTLYFDDNIPLVDIQDKLSKLNFLESSEPNFIQRTQATPNDIYYSRLWGMEKIRAPQAWDTINGSSDIIVAVIDTGIDSSHPDLEGKLVTGASFVPSESTTQDLHGHGTHVAGTIGAIGNNSVGVVGVNWDIRLMPVKALGASGSGNGYINGIVFASSNGAKVLNLSLGGRSACPPSAQAAIDSAISRGVVVAVAAGNAGQDAQSHAPANCNGVITVGNSTPSDSRAGSSNYGASVEIAAPGSGIFSTVPLASTTMKRTSNCQSTLLENSYCSVSGTSMASPHVAGAAALLLAARPGMTPQEVTDCLVSSGDPISTDRPIGPRLNVFNAISNCRASQPGITSSPTVSPTGSPGVTQVPVSYTIEATLTLDANGNQTKDPGDTPISGATVSISGTFATSATTGSNGIAIFPNLKEGRYNVSAEYQNQNMVFNSPIVFPNGFFDKATIEFLVVPAGTPIIVTGAPTLTPTSTPIPTLSPVPTGSGSSPPPGGGGGGGGGGAQTPAPTPIVRYNCQFDPKCSSGQRNLQLCNLICTRIN